MSKVVQYSEMNHFADETNFLYQRNSIKKVNRYINHDLKLIVQSQQNITGNVDETEIIIFQPKGKDTTKKLNFWISGQQTYISK